MLRARVKVRDSNSTADTTHTSLRRDKFRLADVMPLFLLPHHAAQKFSDRFVRIPFAQARAQIVFRHTEKTRPHLAVGC
jgi:hypothetical protein